MTVNTARSWLAVAAIVGGGCLALGTLGAIEARHVSVTHGFPVPWGDIVVSTMPRWVLLAAVLPLAFGLGLARPVVPVVPATALLHVAAMLALSAAHAAIDVWSADFASPMLASLFPWTARVLRSWYHTAPTVVSLYIAVVGAAWGLTEMRERRRRSVHAAQLEAQLVTARLTALRAQLQPHFLYNTLQGIAALVGDARPDQAIAAIEQLGELLHATLRDDARTMVAVDEEVALAGRYLALQQMRFADRLRFELSVEPAAADCLVPVLVLQPIVENAVVHGLDAGEPVVRVVVTAEIRDNELVLTVENNGPVLPGRRGGHGVGLAATRARLLTGYGDRASLVFEPRAAGGAVVRVVLPRAIDAERLAIAPGAAA